MIRRHYYYSSPRAARSAAASRMPSRIRSGLLHTSRLVALPLLLAALLGLGACVYRINIQQGNFLDPKAIDQLATGMTRSQVRFLLGTPMVGNAFDPDRWDYVYYMKRGRIRAPEKRKITVFFEDDRVTRIERPEQEANRVADSKSTQNPPTADKADAGKSQQP